VPFFGERDDQELVKIIKYIVAISDSEDVRRHNREQFRLN